jgi:integrase
MSNRSSKRPKYCHHKPSGRAYVRLTRSGQRETIYLGDYDSPESWDLYNELVSGWLKQLDDEGLYCLTIDELALLYLNHCKSYYVKAGKQTSEYECVRSALRYIIRSHGTELARSFGPKKLKAVRQAMIEAEYARSTINKHVGRIRRMFRWGVENEYVTVDVLSALQALAGLRKGRSEAKETTPVKPVPQEHVNAVLPRVSVPVANIIRFQQLTGMRPEEAVEFREGEIEQEDDVWLYVPRSHKTEHHDKDRMIFIGPQAQKVIVPLLTGDPEQYVFRPVDSVNYDAEFNRCYRVDSYRQAIQRACKRAKVPSWSPNQLRHNVGTAIRKRFGTEAAQVVLGHGNLSVTEVYAERDMDLARKVMSQLG